VSALPKYDPPPVNVNQHERQRLMAKYLFQGSYVGEGLKGLVREGGTPRIEAAKKLFASLGGTLECFYFAFGSEDLVVICDLPDNVSALAFSLAINNSGMAQGRVTVLATAEEVDAAVKKTPQYRAPGQN
jgi:uncharacterized protein with GYD domain